MKFAKGHIDKTLELLQIILFNYGSKCCSSVYDDRNTISENKLLFFDLRKRLVIIERNT